MKLYHGTSTKYLEKILQNGLQPRGRRKGNWQSTILSRSDAVYLTTAYSVYFAMQATKKPESGLVLEIDSTKLNPFRLHPDEDFLGQMAMHADNCEGLRNSLKTDNESLLYSLTKHFRDILENNQHMWEDSIEFLGNCCHIGTIPLDAITRYVIIPNVHRMLAWADPTISVSNFRIMGDYYKTFSSMVMGDTPADQHPHEFMRLPPPDVFRDVKVHTLQKETA